MLRDLGAQRTGFTYETDGSSWVWPGTIEISEAAATEGLVPSRDVPVGAESDRGSTVAATAVERRRDARLRALRRARSITTCRARA